MKNINPRIEFFDLKGYHMKKVSALIEQVELSLQSIKQSIISGKIWIRF